MQDNSASRFRDLSLDFLTIHGNSVSHCRLDYPSYMVLATTAPSSEPLDSTPRLADSQTDQQSAISLLLGVFDMYLIAASPPLLVFSVFLPSPL